MNKSRACPGRAPAAFRARPGPRMSRADRDKRAGRDARLARHGERAARAWRDAPQVRPAPGVVFAQGTPGARRAGLGLHLATGRARDDLHTTGLLQGLELMSDHTTDLEAHEWQGRPSVFEEI